MLTNKVKYGYMNQITLADHPIAIFIRGLPGSGKTFVAAALMKAIGEGKVVNLDPDATDYSSKEYLDHTKALTSEGIDTKLHPYRFLRAKAYDGIAANKIIIWNQPFTNLEIFHKMADRLQNHAAKCKTRLPMLVVEVEIDTETAKERVVTRKSKGGHGPSGNTFTRFTNDYASFETEGFNVVKVDGRADVNQSVAAIMRALEPLTK